MEFPYIRRLAALQAVTECDRRPRSGGGQGLKFSSSLQE